MLTAQNHIFHTDNKWKFGNFTYASYDNCTHLTPSSFKVRNWQIFQVILFIVTLLIYIYPLTLKIESEKDKEWIWLHKVTWVSECELEFCIIISVANNCSRHKQKSFCISSVLKRNNKNLILIMLLFTGNFTS